MLEAPPRAARLLVYAFLTIVVVTSTLAVESWPLTGWKLFSQVRGGTVTGWQVVTVDAEAIEHPIDFASLPRGYHGWYQVVSRFPSMREEERGRVLASFATAAAERGADVLELRVYRTSQRVRTDFARPSPVPIRSLRYQASMVSLVR